jgi:hypothetical protein
MDVYLNDQPVTDPIAPEATVNDVLTAVREANPAMLIARLRRDGVEVAPERLEAVLAERMGAPGRLDVELEGPMALGARLAGEVAELLEQSRQRRVEIAEAVAAGKQARAMERLTETFNAWNTAEQALQKIAQLVGLDLDHPVAEGVVPAELIEQLRDHLRQVKQALQIRDYVAVADLVEHRQAPIIDGWQQMLVSLQQKMLG